VASGTITFTNLVDASTAQLDAVLEEEVAAWRTKLDWDFRPAAEMVRRYVERKAINGSALLVDGVVAGYGYAVADEHKGIVGNLYVRAQERSQERENALLRHMLENLLRTPRVRRVESQLMALDDPLRSGLPGERYLHVHERNFMIADLEGVESLPVGRAAAAVLVLNWVERRQDEAAQVIVASYHGHVDGQINDQYRSPGGARRFLMNIVHYPGCGTFQAAASFMAADRATGRLCGISLASKVADDVGHITQICVTPEVKGTGVGYELLRHSLAALAAAGYRKASLTVTASNHKAVEFYEEMGFATRRKFAAYVWDT
jgi:ribosomal protein S18 acetylase RimI-like enzyme